MIDRSFDDFLSANADELGVEEIESATRFKNRLVVANRLFRAMFPGESRQPNEPGSFQGTLMLAKLRQELDDGSP